MKARHIWNSIRMHNLQAAIDPDAPLHTVTVPETWGEQTATAILQLCPEYQLDKPVIQAGQVIANWLLPLCEQSTSFSMEDWETILLLKQACPNVTIWKQDNSKKLGITINLAAFASSETGFDAYTYRRVLQIVSDSLRILYQQQSDFVNAELPFTDTLQIQTNHNPQLSFDTEEQHSAGVIYLSNLDTCLAILGYDYDSDHGRDVACCITCFATLLANAGCGADLLPLSPDWNALPELSQTAKEIWSLASDEPPSRLYRLDTSFSSPGPADILLGSESCGLAPNFSLLTENGQLTTSTLARLSYKGFTLETALASALAGEPVLQPASIQAHYAMHQALAGFVTHMPSRPNQITYPLSLKASLPRGVRYHLPPRSKGISQKTSIAGRGLFIRTGEYDDGSLGEISITPARENAMVKGLLDSFGQAISIGLQYGVPLKEYVSTFAYSRFGIAGTVEGDPDVTYATSFLDYSFRTLSDIYLNQHLPDAPNNINSSDHQTLPMLPLELPEDDGNHDDNHSPSTKRSRHRKFKLVS